MSASAAVHLATPATQVAVRPMTRTDIEERRSIFEYACHEGNYSVKGILAGARAEERSEP